ncbi:MAG: Trk system potassium transporter TrkA [Desulfobacterales bacterium]|uniref:Trk system potassium uptake protein TrkA n=1 Tax=Candidatus Desulfaltia bathyphila TaxID=2841697 RepID=A0A8J6N592_9BACT|nr:Trk system potassium transporter TrkA [Candidatus Desulfaltia bathyphila]MBL7194958.1 Trk system potassium transporter TrkA [Desulfobacterales bacterium]MBL7207481.1 Trk system potassium transporter TrkA [Desulfobacterales bacterium]
MKVVIIGAGEVGFNVASRLVNENKDVVVIDKDHEAIRRVSDNIDAQVVNGSGSSPISLDEAGLKDAEILLAVTNSDEANLVACLVADILSPSTKKLARVRNADFDQYHDNFRKYAPHIDTLINPEIEVVKTIDRMMNMPGVVDVGEFADGRIKFIAIRLDKDARLAGTRLSELFSISEKQRPLIVAVIREEKLIIPSGDDALLAGDLVYFICEEEKLLDTLAVFDKHAEPVQRVLIIGGGKIGIRLARLLDEKSIYTKIIEKNPDRCAKLAERLNKVVVLHGDGSDQELLKEENIQDVDVVVTLTDDEEINILASLLAKQMGARKTITKISKFSYFPLMSTIGIEQVVSPRLSAINTILQHIRRGKVLSSISIKGEQAEFMEAVALETSDIVGKPLKNIFFPKGALVAGIIREENFVIPTGDSIVNPGDMIIIFARKQAVPKVEKILAVKLEYF